jgi:hypothetical protein
LAALCPWGDLASTRNEYNKYLLGVKGGQGLGLTTLPPSYADCPGIWEPQTAGALILSRPVMGHLYIKEMEWYSVDWIYMVQDRYKWSAVVCMLMKLRDSQNAGYLMTR